MIRKMAETCRNSCPWSHKEKRPICLDRPSVFVVSGAGARLAQVRRPSFFHATGNLLGIIAAEAEAVKVPLFESAADGAAATSHALAVMIAVRRVVGVCFLYNVAADGLGLAFAFGDDSLGIGKTGGADQDECGTCREDDHKDLQCHGQFPICVWTCVWTGGSGQFLGRASDSVEASSEGLLLFPTLGPSD